MNIKVEKMENIELQSLLKKYPDNFEIVIFKFLAHGVPGIVEAKHFVSRLGCIEQIDQSLVLFDTESKQLK